MFLELDQSVRALFERGGVRLGGGGLGFDEV